jgi:transcriptional regulator with XRE-family HTH domain
MLAGNKGGRVKTIKELRLERGWTQLDLAYRAGITPLTVSKWERGVSEPRVTQLRKLAELFEVSMDNIDLVEREEDLMGKAVA